MKAILTALTCLVMLNVTAGSAAAGHCAPLCAAVQKVRGAASRSQAIAEFDDVTGALTISNIGSSGLDGVEIDVRLPGHKTLGTFMDWQWWDPNDSLPIGAMFQSEILGTIGGVPDQQVGAWRMTKTAPATYDSIFIDLGFPVGAMRVVVGEQNETVIGEIPSVPEGAAVVMRVDPGVLDPEQPFQQAWIVGEGTEEPVPGGIPIPPWAEVFCGELFECEYHGWPALSEVGLRIDGDLVQTIATDPNETTGILAVLGDGMTPSNVEEITTLRLTFANIPEFQIRNLQLLAVPEPSAAILLAGGMGLSFWRRLRRRTDDN